MKSPKQEAKELVNGIKEFLVNSESHCALGIELDLAIMQVNKILKVTHSDKRGNSPFDKEYWQEVMKELKK